jgi:hypothetical protein
LRPPRHDPEDWPCDGPPWLWPTEAPSDDPEEPDEEEPVDEEPVDELSDSVDELSEPVEEPVDELSDPVDDDDDEPEDDDPEDDDPLDCVPEKSTAEVMPAAARLDSPTIEVARTATRFPADRESMIATSVSGDSSLRWINLRARASKQTERYPSFA